MQTAYIIVQGEGEWLDRREWPAKVYLDRGKAEAMMGQLESLRNKYQSLADRLPERDVLNGAFSKLNDAAIAEYKLLGFDAEAEHDWELAEAEIEQ